MLNGSLLSTSPPPTVTCAAARWCLPGDPAFQVEQRLRFGVGKVGKVGRSDAGDAKWANGLKP